MANLTEARNTPELIGNMRYTRLVAAGATVYAGTLVAQTAPQWEACLWDGHSTDPATLEALRAAAARDPRIRVTFSEENGGISRNTNGALSMARYDWIALCDHDDLLAPDAVYRILDAAEGGADFVYTDEDKCDEAGERFFDPHLKPDFAPDSLRSGNYICHMMAMEKALMLRAGAMREAFDGSQDHDLALRATELAEHIVHIPRVLYHWRMVNTSFSHQKIEQCAHVAASAVGDQLRRLGLPGTSDTYLLNCRVDYGDDPDMTVSLILTPAQDGSWRGLGRLLRRTAQPIHEIIAVGREAPTVRGISVKTADSLNQAAELASGRALVFLQCGMIPAQRDWLRQLTMFLRRQDVGCAGAPITDRRHCYLHCGYQYSGNNTVTADRELIKTVIENLIDNAVNYASDNSFIEIKIEGTAFSISNQCDNLTKSDLKEITKPYVKKDKSRHQYGNGLGLAIVKAILDLHGVKYDMEMKENTVSFSFEL